MSVTLLDKNITFTNLHKICHYIKNLGDNHKLFKSAWKNYMLIPSTL
jgi:hypothetical protein